MEAIVVALIAVAGGALNIYLTAKTKQAAENVDRKTETNHGKEPWQYLEMVQDVRSDVQDLRTDVLSIREHAHKTARAQEDLHVALIEHTAQDSVNFEALERILRERFNQ